ncbi:excalibur calcium-binding domain-containing protein [Marinobacterium sp. BA1]|uniref:excalibur calcium-binding domain-containing protein n=1 Tax=Marinobacterium sp. BA1 TaxID=3138931 RepID=UPI0034E8E4E5
MRKLIIAALIAVAGWSYYQNRGILPSATIPDTHAISTHRTVSREPSPVSTSKSVKPAQTFTCDGRQHCSQMRSRAEAEYFNRYCPNTKMDGDRDGIPCENDTRF